MARQAYTSFARPIVHHLWSAAAAAGVLVQRRAGADAGVVATDHATIADVAVDRISMVGVDVVVRTVMLLSLLALVLMYAGVDDVDVAQPLLLPLLLLLVLLVIRAAVVAHARNPVDYCGVVVRSVVVGVGTGTGVGDGVAVDHVVILVVCGGVLVRTGIAAGYSLEPSFHAVFVFSIIFNFDSIVSVLLTLLSTCVILWFIESIIDTASLRSWVMSFTKFVMFSIDSCICLVMSSISCIRVSIFLILSLWPRMLCL